METITRVLRVTNDVSVAERSSWRVLYTPTIEGELGAEHIELLLITRLLLNEDMAQEDEYAAMTLASLPKGQTVFEYLASCWARNERERASPLYEDLKQYILGYIALVVSEPSAFPQPTEEAARRPTGVGWREWLPLLLPYVPMWVLYEENRKTGGKKNESSGGSSEEESRVLTFDQTCALISQLAQRYCPVNNMETDQSFDDIVSVAIFEMSQLMQRYDLDLAGGCSERINGSRSLLPSKRLTSSECEISWRNIYQAMSKLYSDKATAHALTVSSYMKVDRAERAVERMKSSRSLFAGLGMDPSANTFHVAPLIEQQTLLGPILQLGAFPDRYSAIARSYFLPPSLDSRLSNEEILANTRVLQGFMTTAHGMIGGWAQDIVRASAAARDSFLDYVAQVLEHNVRRAAMQVNPRQVGTHGFLLNLHVMLLKLAAPFMDRQLGKIDRIDMGYYLKSKRINLEDTTRMNADKEEVREIESKFTDTTPPNFISEVFFLTLAAQHLGPTSSIPLFKSLERQLQQCKRYLREAEQELEHHENLPDRDTSNATKMAYEQAKRQVEDLKKRRNEAIAMLSSCSVELLDPTYVGQCLDFMHLTMGWLIRVVDPTHRHPQVPVDMAKLPTTPPDAFRILPEYIIEDIGEYLLFASRHAPQEIVSAPHGDLITFMLLFMTVPYMKNMHLKAQFVEVMYYLTLPMVGLPSGPLGDSLCMHPTSIKYLMHALVTAYIQVETTGASTQFYDKFNSRFFIEHLFNLVWDIPAHQVALKNVTADLGLYIRFVNMMMNDTTYLIEEALLNLAKCVEVYRLQKNEAAWAQLTPEERAEKNKLLTDCESHARSDLDFGSKALGLMDRFSRTFKSAFLTREIVDRLCAMLDNTLFSLAGPRCQDLKVRDPKALNFSPKDLLRKVLVVFVNLGSHKAFQEGIARDERSYSKELFERSLAIAGRTSLLNEHEAKVITDMVSSVEAIRAAYVAEALDDVPDDLLDPLTFDLLTDPVILPSSKQIISRPTIMQHFLSSATDPFNRQPLDLKDLVDAVEVRDKIQEFLRSKGRA